MSPTDITRVLHRVHVEDPDNEDVLDGLAHGQDVRDALAEASTLYRDEEVAEALTKEPGRGLDDEVRQRLRHGKPGKPFDDDVIEELRRQPIDLLKGNASSTGLGRDAEVRAVLEAMRGKA